MPVGYDFEKAQTIGRVLLRLSPPSMDDQTDDWARLCTALRRRTGIDRLRASLPQIRELGGTLRSSGWHVGLTYDTAGEPPGTARLIKIGPMAAVASEPLCGLAIDVGTTTVTVFLVDLLTGEVTAQSSEYNQQIARGEDVISRIIYATKGGGGEELRELVLATINGRIAAVCGRANIEPVTIVKATVSGNSTMMHLLLGIPPESIRLEPFITPINHPPLLSARDVGITMCPEGTVDCLPGVASYLGADITAGVLSSGLRSSAETTLFIDVGTNGEIVLGSSQWLASCACSAGPAFEGSGVVHGMRADRGSHRRGLDRRPELRADLPGDREGAASRDLRKRIDLAGRRDVPHRHRGQGRAHRREPFQPTDPARRARGRVRRGLGEGHGGRRRHHHHGGGHRQPAEGQGRGLCGLQRPGRPRGRRARLRRKGADRRIVRQVHQRREGRGDRLAARSSLGAFRVPGEHLGQGRLSRPAGS